MRRQHPVRRLAYDAELVWNNPLAVDLDSLAHPPHDSLGGFVRCQHEILLRQLVPRMHDPVRDLAIIREKQQPFGVPIEPADRYQPGLSR